MSKGVIFDIKEFSVHDGRGIRTTIFLKGCPLRCQWCHNPEGLSIEPQLMVTENGCINCNNCYDTCEHEECKSFKRCIYSCSKGLLKISGSIIEAKDLAEKVKKQKMFFESSGGGVTISGGEPLFQHEFLIDLLKELYPLHRLIETSGYSKPEIFEEVLNNCDEIFFDIKHPIDEVHKKITGVSNVPILENLERLKKSKKPYTIRVPLTSYIDQEAIFGIAEIFNKGDNGGLEQIEFMPYNNLANAKYKMMDMLFEYVHGKNNIVNFDCFEKNNIRTIVL